MKVMKGIEVRLLNGKLRWAIARVVGKPGSLRFRLARDTVGVMAIQALSMGLAFAVSVVLARLLGVREFGLYSLAMSVPGLLGRKPQVPLEERLHRAVAWCRQHREWAKEVHL